MIIRRPLLKSSYFRITRGENVDFRAGGYIQIECPEYENSYSDFDIEEEYRGDWISLNFGSLRAEAKGHYVLIQWLTILKKKVLSCLMCVLLHHLQVNTIRSRQVKCHLISLI